MSEETPPLSSSAASHIRHVHSEEEGISEQQQREGQLMVLLPLSRKNERGERELQEFRVYVELSAFLAFHHVQHRSGKVLPGLPSILEGCDFRWNYRHHDAQFSPLQAARELLSYQKKNKKQQQQRPHQEADSEAADVTGAESSGSQMLGSSTSNNNSTITPAPVPAGEDQIATAYPFRTVPPWTNPPLRTVPPRTPAPYTTPPRNTRQLQQQSQQQTGLSSDQLLAHPFAVVGAARSTVSQTVSILGGAMGLPQISSSSTASILDESPFFARTVPTNQADAHASIIYLSRLGVTHLGVLFIKDSWGRRYEQDLQHYAKMYNIEIFSVAYTDESNLDQPLQQLKRSELRYFMAVINPSAWKPVVQKAYDVGIMGQPKYHWLIGDLVELVGDGFALNRETEGDIARALHGTGVVFLQITPHEAFDQALSEVAQNETLQDLFIASHSEPHLLENFTFSASPGQSLFQYLTYDAVIALGITACNTPGLFSGQEFYDNLLKVDFEGVSGQVNLHEKTGTRLGSNMQYQVVNMIFDDYLPGATLTGDLTFTAKASSLVELSPPNASGPEIREVIPFVYHDNTTIPPFALPPLNGERNLIPKGVQAFGLLLAALVMSLSLFYGIWVLKNRETYVIRASQPVFLVQLCIGTFIIGLTIIPMSFQEDLPKTLLDISCMSVPWFFAIGFTVAISALFTKARRINKLLNSGSGFRRVQVKAQHVMRPFFIMLTINVILLTAWTASPWHLNWNRIDADNSFDQFGRIVESYGVCRANGKLHFLFSTPLVLTNIIILFLATYQSYQAKDLPSEFSETLYLAFTMIGLTETFIIGISIIFVVIDNPPAFFLASAVLICIGCLSILLPVFVPKFKLRHYINQPQGRNSAAIAIRSVTKSRIDRSSIKMPSNNSLTNHSLSTHGYSIHRNSSSSLPSAFARSTINPGSGHQGPRHSRQSSDLPTYGAHRVKRTHMRQSSPPYAGRVTFVVPASASPPLRTHVEDKPQQQQEEEGSSSLGSGSSFQ